MPANTGVCPRRRADSACWEEVDGPHADGSSGRSARAEEPDRRGCVISKAARSNDERGRLTLPPPSPHSRREMQFRSARKTPRHRVPLVSVTTSAISGIWLQAEKLSFLREAGVDVISPASPAPDIQRFAEHKNIEVVAIPMAREMSPAADFVSLVRESKTLVIGSASSNGVNAARVINKANSAELPDLALRHGITPETPVVGFAGRLTKDKWGTPPRLSVCDRTAIASGCHTARPGRHRGWRSRRSRYSLDIDARLQRDHHWIREGYIAVLSPDERPCVSVVSRRLPTRPTGSRLRRPACSRVRGDGRRRCDSARRHGNHRSGGRRACLGERHQRISVRLHAAAPPRRGRRGPRDSRVSFLPDLDWIAPALSQAIEVARNRMGPRRRTAVSRKWQRTPSRQGCVMR